MGNRAHIIFDGYNCIFRTRHVDRRNPDALEQARDDFIAQVTAFRGNRQIDITVVFDGSTIPAPEVTSGAGGIKVIFSKPPKNADRVIIDHIESAATPGSITVVSSDNFVRSSAAALGCRTMTTEEFQHKLLKETSSDIEEKYSGNMTQADVDEWLKLFSQKPKNEQT